MKKPFNTANISFYVSLVVLILALIKLGIYWFSGSLIVLLSTLDSIGDFMMSYVNFKVIRYARRTADSDHPYGHGKAESIVGLTQGIILTLAGLLIIYSSLVTLVKATTEHSSQTHFTHFHATFFILTAALSVGLNYFLQYYGKKYKSPALMSDGAHYAGDFWTNLGTGSAIILHLNLGLWWLDSTLAAVFSFPVIYQGLKLFRTNCDELMDHDVSADLKEQILSIVQSSYADVKDIHRFRGRKSGDKYFFDFHITLPHKLTFSEVHTIVDRLEERLLQDFDADVVIHADPDSH